jgi:hypothetical protein
VALVHELEGCKKTRALSSLCDCESANSRLGRTSGGNHGLLERRGVDVSFGGGEINTSAPAAPTVSNPFGVFAIGAEGEPGGLFGPGLPPPGFPWLPWHPVEGQPVPISRCAKSVPKYGPPKTPCLIHFVACHSAEPAKGSTNQNTSAAAQLARATHCFVLAGWGFVDKTNGIPDFGGPKVLFDTDGNPVGNYPGSMRPNDWAGAMARAGLHG